MPDLPAATLFPADLRAAYPLEELLGGLLTASLTGIALYTPLRDAEGTLVDFTIDLLNPAAQRILGQPARPRGTYLQYYPHTLDTGVFAFHRDAFESGAPARFEVNYQGDGLDNYFRLSAQRVGPGLLVSFTDTADEARTAVEEALRESQAREQTARAQAERERGQVQALLEQAPVAIGLLEGPTLHVKAVNPLLSAMWGRPPADVLHRPLLEAVPELRGQGFEELLQQVLTTQVPYVGTEVPAQMLRDGRLQTTYYNFVYQPFYDVQGAVQGVLNVVVEVTEQVRARQQVQQLNEELAATNKELQAANEEIQLTVTALEQAQRDLLHLNQTLEGRVSERTHEVQLARAAAEGQRQRLERLFQQAPAAICIFDGPDLVYELVNPGYQQLFPGRALLGKPLLEALPELTDQPVWHSLRRVYTTGETHQEVGRHILVAKYAGGPLEDFYFSYTQQARYDEHGRIDGVLVFTFDVTEQVRARQQVQELNDQLAALNEELQARNEELQVTNQQLTRTNVDLDTFIYTASHDLKAPISNIEGILLALREQLLPPVLQDPIIAELLAMLQSTVIRFQATIAQLTDISKLQLAHTGPAERVQLAAIVEEVRLDLAPALRSAATQLLVEVDSALVVSFSPANLRSIVYNLLSNAVKYRHPDRPSVVRVHAARQPQAIVLKVQDNGLGLSEQQQGQLFGLFKRLHTHVEGTGVGLYIVKRLVENAGGTITVDSQLDVGTTFTVSFPAMA